MVRKTLEEEIWDEIYWRQKEIRNYKKYIKILKLALKQLESE